MKEFSLEILGLQEVINLLKDDKKLTKTLLPALGKAVEHFHNSLSQEVTATYNTRKKLSSVLVGGRSLRSNTSFGEKILKNGLTYRGEKLPLAQFIVSSTDDPNLNRGRFMIPQKGVSLVSKDGKKRLIKRISPNKRYMVEVKRGNSKLVHGHKGFGAFLLKGKFPYQLGSRSNERTWIREPITRESYRFLYTLSLPEMAEQVFLTSPKVEQSFFRMQNIIADSVLNSFR